MKMMLRRSVSLCLRFWQVGKECPLLTFRTVFKIIALLQVPTYMELVIFNLNIITSIAVWDQQLGGQVPMAIAAADGVVSKLVKIVRFPALTQVRS